MPYPGGPKGLKPGFKTSLDFKRLVKFISLLAPLFFWVFHRMVLVTKWSRTWCTVSIFFVYLWMLCPCDILNYVLYPLFPVFTPMPKIFAWYCTTTQKQPEDNTRVFFTWRTKSWCMTWMPFIAWIDWFNILQVTDFAFLLGQLTVTWMKHKIISISIEF